MFCSRSSLFYSALLSGCVALSSVSAMAKPKDSDSSKKAKTTKKAKNSSDKPPILQEGGGFEPDKVIVYKKIDSRKRPPELHLFLPEGYQTTDRRPVGVFFFGGGWSGNNPKQFYPQAKYFASRGMLTICATYRSNSAYKTQPYDCVEDAKSAVRYVRGHAKELGIDPAKILVGGGSAGGHLAAATATIKDWDCKQDDLTISAMPNALMLFNPVFDNGPGGYANNEKDSRVKDYWKKISPLHNLNGKQPPTIVFVGDQDKHISVEKTKLYEKTMQDNGNLCEAIIYPGEKHGFFNLHKAGPENFIKTLTAGDLFLEKLGYLEGKPKVKEWLQQQLPQK